MGSGVHRRLRDTITYWAATGYGAFGERSFAAPVVFSPPYSGAHWEDLTDIRMAVKPGDMERIRTHVYTQQVVLPEGYLYLGSSNATDPTTLTPSVSSSGATKIQRVDRMPSTNSSVIVYRVVCE